MTFTSINAVVASALVAVSLVQTAPQQAKPKPEAGTAITVVGCLRKWQPSMATQKGFQNPARLEYVLNDLAPGTTAAPALPNVVGFLVKAKDSTVVLTPHLNHRVEVTGMMTGLSESNPTATPLPMAPVLTITTVKMISTECI